MNIYIYISMVAPGLNYLWCHNSGWEQKRTTLPPHSDSLRRAVAPDLAPPLSPIGNVSATWRRNFFIFIFGLVVCHFFYTTCNLLLCFFFCFLLICLHPFRLFVQPSVAAWLLAQRGSRAWLPKFEKKKKKEQKKGRKMGSYLKWTKVEEKGKCLAQFFLWMLCACFSAHH